MHKSLWFKIHWILGITAGVVLLIIGTTGAILSFEKEILKVINKDSYIVKVQENQQKLTTKELLEKFQIQMPDAKINSISYSNELDESTILNIASKESRKGINYYVNPYTAEILPQIIGKDFFGFILRLHRWLAFEGETREIGKQIVAISTISLIVLIISAVVIYWGRIKHSFFKSFTFKFKHKGRAFLSTMHSAIGMWVIPFYLLASLTGLMWSYDWFNNSVYKIAGVEKPQKGQQGQQKGEQNRGKDDTKTELNFESHQKAVELFDSIIQNEYSKVNLRFPQNGTTYSFSYLDKNPAHYRALNTIEIDINSSEIKKHEKYLDKPLNERLLKSILPLHTGEYFGIIGQIGMFISASLMSLFTITGFMLYLQRRKKKQQK